MLGYASCSNVKIEGVGVKEEGPLRHIMFKLSLLSFSCHILVDISSWVIHKLFN